MNQTRFPKCFEMLRQVQCGIKCSKYVNYYVPVATAPPGEKYIFCNSTCFETNRICVKIWQL